MTPSTLISAFAEDVRHYLQLSPRQLPSMYLYDALGSALFDAICELPWYAITRAEMRLLERHRTEIFAHLPGLTRLVELGPGDGRKLKTLVEGTSEPLIAHLVDVSAGALERAAHTLSDALNLSVVTHQAPFEDGLDAIMREESGDRTLVLFLGSNIGNFDQRGSRSAAQPHRRVARTRRRVPHRRGSRQTRTRPAAGLRRSARRERGVQSECAAAHQPRAGRHTSTCARSVIARSGMRRARAWTCSSSRRGSSGCTSRPSIWSSTLREGEAIWTESSYKYTPDGLIAQLRNSGFESLAQWIDPRAGFALTLARTA